jgi:hypothetical protein
MHMKFKEGRRYWSDDGRELFVIGRRERTRTDGTLNPRIYAEVGLGMPAYYKIRLDFRGRETVTAKNRVFTAAY